MTLQSVSQQSTKVRQACVSGSRNNRKPAAVVLEEFGKLLGLDQDETAVSNPAAVVDMIIALGISFFTPGNERSMRGWGLY